MVKKTELSSGIKNWPDDDKPREKLLKQGEHKLSNTELLEILLGSGTKGESAIDLARKDILKFKNFRNISKAELKHWQEFKGLGQAKIAQVKAAIEIGRRFNEETGQNQPQVKSSQDIVKILMPRMRDLKKEVFKTVFLNSRSKIIGIHEVVEGTVNQVFPIIREIFQKALQEFAVSLICVHNHPSGDPSPSKEDKHFTRELIQAGKVLQINILDHIIIGNNRYYSFVDQGII